MRLWQCFYLCSLWECVCVLGCCAVSVQMLTSFMKELIYWNNFVYLLFFYFGSLSCLYKFKWLRVVLLKLKTCTCAMKCLLSEKNVWSCHTEDLHYCQAFTPCFLGIFCHASVPEVSAKVFNLCTTLWRALRLLFFIHVCMWIAYIFCCVYGCAVSYISTVL